MRLKKIIENIEGVKKIEGRLSLDVKGIACDSKKVKDSFLFAAIKGSRLDGAEFIYEAIDRGANSIILEWQRNKSSILRKGPTYIYVDDVRDALSESSRMFFGDLSRDMYIIGITGTNGKTTTTYLIESLFKARSQKTGLIGTINYRFGNRSIPSFNTTPGILDLYSLLKDMKKNSIKNCIIEVSSHSLEQKRVDTLKFDIAIFTNLTSEHLDYHKTMDNYLESKIRLFTKIKEGGFAIINKDDAAYKKIEEKVRMLNSANIISYGLDNSSDVYAKEVECSLEGLRFTLCTPGGSIGIESRLIGRHNVYNILAACASGIAMGMDIGEVKTGIESLLSLPGRLERVDCGQDFLVFVDYAHTEDSLGNVLKALKGLNPRRILCVFGCGGERDKSKREKMGRVSSQIADKIFITSDNPRSEEPMDIINEIIRGLDRKDADYIVEIDRFKAIAKALEEAKKGDIVLVAGKGHETYQIFKDIALPFDDREAVEKILKGRSLCSRSKIS